MSYEIKRKDRTYSQNVFIRPKLYFSQYGDAKTLCDDDEEVVGSDSENFSEKITTPEQMIKAWRTFFAETGLKYHDIFKEKL